MLSIPIEFMVISGLLYCFNHRLNQPPHHASGRGCRRRSRRRLRRCLRRGAAAWFLGNWGIVWTSLGNDFRRDVFFNRRKFRSQTSDNMDRWKAEVEQKNREEKRRREKIREEKESEEEKMQVREKVGKSRNTVFFQWFVAPEGRKVGSLKRRVRSQLARWEMKNCTPLWREAHFEVKMYKAHQVWTLLAVEMSKKCTPLWREAHFEVKMWKTPGVRTTFGGSNVISRGRCKGLWTLSKVSKTWGFCSISKNDGRRGTCEEDLQRCIFRGRRSTRDMLIRAVRRGPGADFLRRVTFWSIRSSVLGTWFCVTGAALRMTWHHFFVAGAVL